MSPKQQNLKKVTLTDRLQNVNGKTFAAVVLFTIMGLLWARVLLRGGNQPPAAANAQTAQKAPQPQMNTAAPTRLIPVKLPVLAGRHDTFAADIFNAERGHLFAIDSNDETPVVPETTEKDKDQANLEKIAAAVKLEAVVRGNEGIPFQVYVNDEILTVGSVLTVKEGPQEYALVLKKINENEAVFVWRDFTVTLSMAETVEK